MIQKIKGMFDRRILTLLAVLAIGTSGMASMAALTGQLTVTSTFEGAQILISADGGVTTGSATLFADNQVITPGDTPAVAGPKVGDVLKIENVGNIAAHFTYTPPLNLTGTGNLGAEMRVDLWNPSAWALSSAQNMADAVASCKTGGTVGWEPQQTAVSWTALNVSPFDLNSGESRTLCYQVYYPAGSTMDATTNADVEQFFTGTQN